MTSNELRQRFLDFFKKRGHQIVPSSSLIPTDPSVLFTTAGMQQFKRYFLGEKSPYGNKVASCQKCFRTNDIDEVGDNVHHTFFEMLGNWSFGDYFKEEAIDYALEFLEKECGLQKEKLWVTIFKGESDIPRDEEVYRIWHKKGIKKEKIFEFGLKENFWGPVSAVGPCGPCSEIHYEKWTEPCRKRKLCGPNCECGRFVEIWNLVFMTYNKDEKGEYKPLVQKNVDTGIGFERLASVIQEKGSNYETDLFYPIIEEIVKNSPVSYDSNLRYRRIIADHIKGTVFLASEGILPSNVERGYILRRILRRAIRYGKLLNLPRNFLIPLARKTIKIYQDVYSEVESKEADILTVIQNEEEKFEKTLSEGLKQFEKVSARGDIKGEDAFHLFDTYGFPLELTIELAQERNLKVDKKEFENALEKHRQISRAGVEKKFGGIGEEVTYQATRLHTATHLLHFALREVLGKHVKQMGSDITSERLRFDFSHFQKMTEEKIKKVESLVNQKIKEDLEIRKEEMGYEEAVRTGALAFFKEKYSEIVTVYSVAEPEQSEGEAGNEVSQGRTSATEVFSKEVCGGPHVKRTSELGNFKIIKEESCGSGTRRIRAVLK